MASVEKKIAEHIILAQVASDGGKDIDDNLVKYIKGSCPTSWDRKSSREACVALRRFYF